MDLYNIRKIWKPEYFQGSQKEKQYFEGWYFKLVNPDTRIAWAIIPGISYGKSKKDAYPFIQLINGKTGDSYFIKYQLDDFWYSRKSFEVRIADNHFSGTGISLNIHQEGNDFTGSLSFQNTTPYPVSLFSPGAMGWYRFVPTMECYHGIISMHHMLEGILVLQGKEINFTGGKGYIEKDWGKSMPISWIWIQSNHFNREDVSVSFSIANIPWKKSAFTGFLIILSIGDHFYRFTTYNGAGITKLLVGEGEVTFEVMNRHYHLSVHSKSNIIGELKAPVEGEMRRTIKEGMGAEVSIQLKNRAGSMILEDKGNPAAMEIAGDVSKLYKLL